MLQSERLLLVAAVQQEIDTLNAKKEIQERKLKNLLQDCDHTDGNGKSLVVQNLYCSLCHKIVQDGVE